jgi:CelD/BcsL family acetyltransferase involved in cellulose biosynthesis
VNSAASGPSAQPAVSGGAAVPRPGEIETICERLDGFEILVFRDLVAAEPHWRAFEEQADCTVFQTFGYLSTWQRHIGVLEGVEPLIVLARRPDGSPSFLLPLARDRKHGLRRLRWLGQDLADYTGPLLAPDFAARGELAGFVPVWRWIVRLLVSRPPTRFDIVDLRKMPDRIGRQFNPFCYLEVDVHPAGAHYAELSPDWEAFYKERRSSSTRSRDRSKLKRLGTAGEVAFITANRPQLIVPTIDGMFEQKAAFFAKAGIPDVFARPGYRDFYVDLATSLPTHRLVHVARLDVGGVMAAANLGLRFRDRYYYVIASYDPGDLQRFGPGAIHLRELIKQAIEQGVTVFDFTIGDEPYKLEWCNVSIKLYDHLASALPIGWPAAVALRGALWAKRRIKGDPRLWALAQKVRSLKGGGAPAPPQKDPE